MAQTKKKTTRKTKKRTAKAANRLTKGNALFVQVAPATKNWLRREAKRQEITMTQLVNSCLTQAKNSPQMRGC